MTQVRDIYQCNRCKVIMERPTMGRGQGLMATEHFCATCADIVKAEEWQAEEARRMQNAFPRRAASPRRA